MKFSDFILVDATIPNLKATTKEDAIVEMTRALFKAGGLPENDFDDVAAALLQRERQNSTGIGSAVAIPHVKLLDAPRVVGAIATSSNGIDFDSVDKKPVRLLFLVVSPTDKPGEHLAALERVYEIARNEDYFNRALAAKSIQEIAEVLEFIDAESEA